MRARLRMALPATLLVHATTTLCALALSLPLAAAVPAGKVLESPAVGGLFTAIKLLDIAAASPWRLLALPLLLALFLTPFLRLVWLRAQLLLAPLHEHARSTYRSYWLALAVCAACALYQALLAVAAWSSVLFARLVLSGTHDARLQDCVGLLLALPWVWAVFVHAPTLADLAQLALVKGSSSFQRALLEAWPRVDRHVCAARTAYAAALASVLASGLVVRLACDVDVSGTAWSCVWIGQLSAVLQTALRAGWCAWLVEHVEARAAAQENARASLSTAADDVTGPAASEATAAEFATAISTSTQAPADVAPRAQPSKRPHAPAPEVAAAIVVAPVSATEAAATDEAPAVSTSEVPPEPERSAAEALAAPVSASEDPGSDRPESPKPSD